ncbi:MAG: FAD-dependent oxidoreductase [Clostridiales bacterium]|nr:FAD-dependent oxidoreductase [Clostridiales bacterium]
MKKKKEISETYDLIVAGGGLAGVAAACSAAREGLKVLLIEKYGFLGGMATSALVYPFMPHTESGGVLANAGLFLELLQETNMLSGNKDLNSRYCLTEFLKIALDRMIEKYGVTVLFHSKLSDVEFRDRKVMSITVATISGNIKLSAPIFIDATGNADMCAFAGLPYQIGRDEDGLCQPMTLCFRLANIDNNRFDRKAAVALYKEFQKKGLIKNTRENILSFKFPVDNVRHFNTTRVIGYDPTDVEQLTVAEFEARKQMFEMYRFLRDNVEGCENCKLIESAPEIGIRESRRIIGYYEITADDITGTVKFKDSIARCTYAIDIHNPSGTGTIYEKIPENDYYTIPYRAMIPVDADNIIVAGRPLSSTHEAHSSFRIMPVTTCIGEAAGIAASLVKKYGCVPSDVDTKVLQNILIKNGALV